VRAVSGQLARPGGAAPNRAREIDHGVARVENTETPCPPPPLCSIALSSPPRPRARH
jgi:hypothetical protein